MGYVKEAVVAGAITIRGSGRERWRAWAVALIAGAFIAESYWITTAPIALPNDGRDVFMVRTSHACFIYSPFTCGYSGTTTSG